MIQATGDRRQATGAQSQDELRDTPTLTRWVARIVLQLSARLFGVAAASQASASYPPAWRPDPREYASRCIRLHSS